MLIILLPVGFLIKQNSTHGEIRIVEFGKINSVSFLSEQDPVRVRGVQVGIVKKILISKEITSVQLEFSRPVIIYNEYLITAHLKGLMGDRYLSIYPGDLKSKPLRKEIVLKGKFIDGPTEIIAYVGNFKSVLHKFNLLANDLKIGTPEKKSFVQQFVNFTKKTDTLTYSICRISKDIDIAISKNKDTIQQLVNQAAEITDSLSKNIPDLISDLQKTIFTTEEFIGQVDNFLNKADTIVSEAKNPEAVLWKNDIKSIQADLKSLHELLFDLRENGLELPVRLR